jgi:multiple antibiotic resistance protein
MIDLVLLIQIFALVNPLASMPFLLSAHAKGINVRAIAFKAVLAAFCIGVAITLGGPLLFGIFGITLDSFRVAGGAVLFLLGLRMVTPAPEESEAADSIDTYITIMATPLLTGPATISFITIKSFEVGKFAVLTNLCAAFALVGVVFVLFSLLVDRINAKVVDILSRIMGLFLTAVAIELIARGLEGLIVAAVSKPA